MTEHALHSGDAPHHEEKSRWPIVAALGIFGLALGIVLSLSWPNAGLPIVALALIVAVFGMSGWWREVVEQGKHVYEAPAAHAGSGVSTLYEPIDAHATEASKNLRLGMVMFIASEVMFFGAFFGFYFYSRGRVQVWPPVGYHALEWSIVPLINTALLITSGIWFTNAHHAIIHRRRPAARNWLIATLVFGITFLGLQAYEWTHMALNIRDGLMGTAFFLLTGFHGMHVIVGVIFLTVILFRTIAGHFTPQHHFAVQAAGWYWHFVDVVWILLFLVLYVWH